MMMSPAKPAPVGADMRSGTAVSAVTIPQVTINVSPPHLEYAIVANITPVLHRRPMLISPVEHGPSSPTLHV